jgi:hypothetical protein
VGDKSSKKYENTYYFSGEEICKILKEKYDITIENSDLVSKIILNREENGVYLRSVAVGEKVIGSEDFKEIFSDNEIYCGKLKDYDQRN